MNFLVVALIAAVAGGVFLFLRQRRTRRRAQLMATPLSPDQRRLLTQKMPLYRRLPGGLRERLDGLINRFLDEVAFHGARGFEITESVRLLVAAQACLLIVNKENRWYDSLRTIHIYPASFRSRIMEHDGIVGLEREVHRSGESWARGPVVLAWDQAAYGAFVDDDARNVVMHEFAHQLDEQTGVSDGSPLLDPDQSAGRWAKVFQGAYQRLLHDVETGRANVLDAYGATNPAEFFAVAVETFFEQPDALHNAEPDLYREMVQYFRMNPRDWR